jgi:hypothetical protein
MSFGVTFAQTEIFVSQFRRLQLDDEDLQSLERMLAEAPERGKVMPRTGGVRKIRFAPPSLRRGKRGALRVCYAWFPAYSLIAMFLIYTKSEKDTLTRDDEKACRMMVNRMKESLER